MGRIPPPGEKFPSQRKCHPLHPREELGALVLVAMLVLEAKRVLSSTSVPVADFMCEGAEVLEDMSGHAYMLVLAGNASLVLVVEGFSPSNSWRTSWKRNMVSTGDPGHYSPQDGMCRAVPETIQMGGLYIHQISRSNS